MKDRDIKKGSEAAAIFLGLALICLCTNAAFAAQSSDPERDRTKASTPTKKKAVEKSPAVVRPVAKPPARPKRPASSTRNSNRKLIVPTALTGDVLIALNEDECKITISGLDGMAVGGPLVSGKAGERVSRTLPVGGYTIKAEKVGFNPQQAEVAVVNGKPATVAIALVPMFTFLAVSTNVADAEIKIDGIGTFKGSARPQLRLGTYRVTVSRDGYVSETRDAVVSNLTGDTVEAFTLKEIPIADFLSAALTAINSRNFDEAVTQTNKAIGRERDNVEANYLRALAMWSGAINGAGTALFEAARVGKPVPLNVRISTAKPIGVIEGTLVVDKDQMTFTTASRPDLNFTIAKAAFGGLERKTDGQAIPYLTFGGEGTFAGKKKKQKVTLYSYATALKDGKTFCSQASGADRCNADMTSLYEFLAAWKNLK